MSSTEHRMTFGFDLGQGQGEDQHKEKEDSEFKRGFLYGIWFAAAINWIALAIKYFGPMLF